MYQPKQPFNVPAQVLTPTESRVNGVIVKSFADGIQFFCNVRSFGGTEKTVDGVYVLEDTQVIETWYNPAFTPKCRIKLLDDNSVWEVVGTPEDIERRHLYSVLKVRRVKGGA